MLAKAAGKQENHPTKQATKQGRNQGSKQTQWAADTIQVVDPFNFQASEFTGPAHMGRGELREVPSLLSSDLLALCASEPYHIYVQLKACYTRAVEFSSVGVGRSDKLALLARCPLSLVAWQKVARHRLLQARPSVRACGKWRKATCWHYGVGLQYVFMSHCQQHIEASTIASNLHCTHACQMISTPPKLARSALHPRCQMVSTPSQTHPPGVDSWLHPRLTNDKNTRLSASAQHRIPSYTHTRSGASAQHCTHAFFAIHSLAADLTCRFQATGSWK